jgi:ribonuclease HI
MNPSEYELAIYTDGSCLGNPGPGGWAVHCIHFTIYDGCGPKTTNNIMELTAVIKALEKLKEINYNTHAHICIFTDSSYVKNGISLWVQNWIKHDWKTSTGQPVKNKELWEKLYNLSKEFSKLSWKWVKAHNGDPNNEKVDSLARYCAECIKDNIEIKKESELVTTPQEVEALDNRTKEEQLDTINKKLCELQKLLKIYNSKA